DLLEYCKINYLHQKPMHLLLEQKYYYQRSQNCNQSGSLMHQVYLHMQVQMTREQNQLVLRLNTTKSCSKSHKETYTKVARLNFCTNKLHKHHSLNLHNYTCQNNMGNLTTMMLK